MARVKKGGLQARLEKAQQKAREQSSTEGAGSTQSAQEIRAQTFTSDEQHKLTSEQELILKNENQLLKVLTEEHNEIFYDESTQVKKLVDGEIVNFTLAVVPWKLIDEVTFVYEENARIQESLNEHTLGYILSTMRTDGQKYEATGCKDGDRIGVIDGSSRREACKIAQCPYLIFVSDEKLTSQTKEKLSSIANASKPFSFYEQAVLMHRKMTVLGLSPTEYSKKYGVQKARISTSLSLLEVDSRLWSYFPSHTSVQRRVADKIPSVWKQVKSKQLVDSFFSELDEIDFTDKTDLEVVDRMLAVKNALIGNSSVKQNQLKGYEVFSNFALKVDKGSEDGDCSIHLKQATPELIKKIDAFIRNLSD